MTRPDAQTARSPEGAGRQAYGVRAGPCGLSELVARRRAATRAEAQALPMTSAAPGTSLMERCFGPT